MTVERSNFKVSVSGNNKLSEYEIKLRKSVNLTPIYFDQVENYINNRIEDEELRAKVMKIAKRYPHSALGKFIANFSFVLSECQKQINKEKNIDTQKRVVPPQKEITVDNLIDLQSSLDEEWMTGTENLQNNEKSDNIIADEPIFLPEDDLK